MKPIVVSRFPRGSETLWIAMLYVAVPTALSVAAALFEMPCLAVLFAFLAVGLAWAMIETRRLWTCPHCQKRCLRIVASGGIWYEDHREERIQWGECSACGKCAIRRVSGSATWAVAPEMKAKIPPEPKPEIPPEV
jgi:hypothetical protein